MLARSLQFMLISGFGLSVAGLWWLWRHSPVFALAGLLLGLLVYLKLFAIPFFIARLVNRKDPAPPAPLATWVAAWWAEVVAASRVFLWRQAFAWNDYPDQVGGDSGQKGRRGVVLIHGFVCNRGIWGPWLQRLTQDKRAFAAVNLEPVFGSIDDYAVLVEQAVKSVTAASGLPPLVVGHSMGGLAVRAWLRSGAGNDARVHHVVTIGTPHHGTWLGRSATAPNGKQMAIDSRWLLQLQADEPASRYGNFSCFYSNCDNIVFPASTATLSGADNRLVAGAPHLAMAFNASAMDAAFAKL